jgi:hypothetical protein
MSSELSDEAKALVLAGQRALRPSAADKSRVTSALAIRLQRAGLRSAPLQQSASPLRWAGAAKFAALGSGIIASIVVASLYLVRTPGPGESGVATITTSISQVAPNPPVFDVHGAEAHGDALQDAVAPPSITTPNRSSPNQARRERLAEEAALLGEAEKAFHAGNFKRALALTNEHRAKFPNGLLARERVHLRVSSLCGLKRYDEADLEQARLKKLGGSKAARACNRGE